MAKQPIIMPFQTKNSKYIFDGVSSEVIPSSDLIEDIITNYYNLEREQLYENHSYMLKDEFDRTYTYISELIESGMFYKNSIEETNFGDIDDEIINGTGSQLIFVLTEQCNMRCEYCVYSDKYPKEISYSDAEMDFKTAKKAADEYIKIHKKKVEHGYRKPLFVCFYGGEPLLKYDLIEKIVDYVESQVSDIRYYLTTNGLLLNEERIEFFIKHKFNLTFSLDGFKANHDRNRVTKGGKATFDKIIANVTRLQERKKELGQKELISFNCCYDNYTDLYKCIKFFEDNYDLFNPFYCTFAPIKPYDSTYYEWAKEHIIQNNYPATEDELKNSLQKVRDEFFSKDCSPRFREIATALFVGFYTFTIRNKWIHGEYNNSCTPIDKFAVYPNGEFTLCEKMNGRLPVGNVEEGVNHQELQRVAHMLKNNFKNKKCSVCPARNTCSACFMFMDENGNINEEFCSEQKASLKRQLETLYHYQEEGIDFLKLIKINKSQMEMMEANK